MLSFLLHLFIPIPAHAAAESLATTKLSYKDGINIAPYGSSGPVTDVHLVDLTNSGTLDVVYTTSLGEVVVAENLGGGLFSAPEELLDLYGSARRVGIMDFDGNGSKDLILCVNPELFSGSLTNLFYVSDPMNAELRKTSNIVNSSDPVSFFEDFVNDPNECDDLRLADMNDDGILDIVVTMDNRRDNSGTLAILYSDGIGGADLRIISDDLLLGFSTLEIADLDGDFHNDIAVLAQDRDALFVFFSNVNADSKFDVEVIDLQLDGVSGAMAIGHLRSGSSLPDIITVSNKGLNIYQNQGGREFSKDAIFEDGFLPVGSSLRADIYDLDGNGLADILATDIRNDFSQFGLHVFSQDDPFKFSPPVEVKERDATAFTFADVDDDGINDLVIADTLKKGIYAYLGVVVEVTFPPTLVPVTPAPTLDPVTPSPTTLTPTYNPTKALLPNIWIEKETINVSLRSSKVVIKDDTLAVLGSSYMNGTSKTELHIYERKSFESWYLWKKEATYQYRSFMSREYRDSAPLAISNEKILAMDSIYSKNDRDEWVQEIAFSNADIIAGFSVCFDEDTAVVLGRDSNYTNIFEIYHWNGENGNWELKLTDADNNFIDKKGQCHSMGDNRFIVEWYWSTYVFSIDKETWNVTKEESVSPGIFNPTYFIYSKDKMIYGGGSREDSRPGAWIYGRDNEKWVMESELKIPESLSDDAKKSFGYFVSMSNTRAVVSTQTPTTCIYMLEEETGKWVLEALISTGDNSDIVSVSIDNETIAVASDERIHIFNYDPPLPSISPSWQPTKYSSGLPSFIPAKKTSSEIPTPTTSPTELPSVGQDITSSSPSRSKPIEPECGLYSNPALCGCREVEQRDYRGTISVTEYGIECMPWSEQTPHSHSYSPQDYSILESNYCRNPPGSGVSRAWCYTNDPEIRWGYCSVTFCGEDVGLESENPQDQTSPLVDTANSMTSLNLSLRFIEAVILVLQF